MFIAFSKGRTRKRRGVNHQSKRNTRRDLCLHMGIKVDTFGQSLIKRHSYCCAHEPLRKVKKNSCVKNERRASNPAYFPTSAHRAKRCMTCVCLLVFKKVQTRPRPIPKPEGPLNPPASTSEEEY